MKMLFENIEEFRACVPWLYATAKLDSFMLDIETGNGGFDRGVGRGNL